MITDNIKNIFRFIEFLHLNIEHFNNQKPLLDEISQVRKEFNDLDPKINYEHTFIRKELKEKEDELEARFYNECRKGIREKAIELNIINFNDSFGGGFVNIGELIILVDTRNYDRDDVEIILRAKENYVSVLTKVKVDLNRFLTYGIIRDFKNDLFDCFKPFLTDDDKTALGKFKNFDDFLKFCEPQLKNFQLQNDSLEIIKPFEEKLSNAISDEQINYVKTVAEFGIAKTESMITNFIDRENIKMNFQDIKKIENDTVLEAISLYYNYQKLFYEAKNKSDVLKSDKLHFETFPEFLDYLKKEVKDLDFDERHSEVKRMLEQQKIKLENSTFQSEIDEVKIFSENAVKDFKHKLMLSFKNENYKTKTVGFMPTNYNYVLGLIEYEKLYDMANHKNYSDTIVKEQNQKAESIPAPQQEQPIKFTAKEYALAYIFDLYANGRQIPINRIEGSLSKKEIEQYGKDNIQFIKPDTFYNAVKDLNKNYNVSIIKDLQNISQDWLNAVKSLAKDWKKTKAYLTEKELYRE